MTAATAEKAKEIAGAARRGRRALTKLESDTGESALVGIAEAAEFLGVGKPKIWRLIEQDEMPEPVAKLTCGQVWIREELRPLRDKLAAARRERAA